MDWAPATYCSVKTYEKLYFLSYCWSWISSHGIVWKLYFCLSPKLLGLGSFAFLTLNNKLSPLPNTAIWKARRCILNTGFLIPLHAINPSSFPSCTVWPWILVINPVSPVWHVSPKLKMHFAQWNERLYVKLCLLERASSKHSTEGMLGGAAATQSWAGTMNM